MSAGFADPAPETFGKPANDFRQPPCSEPIGGFTALSVKIVQEPISDSPPQAA